jgi:integrase
MTIIERKTSYGVRVWRPGQDPEWVGSFNFKAHGGKREAKAAAKRAEEKALKRRGKRMTVKALVTAYLADYEGRHKLTSTRTAKQRSAFLVKHLGSRYVDDLTPVDALEWKAQVPPYCLSQATTIFNWANRKWITDKNPFAAIYEATEGRSKQAPPTKEEFAAILEACSALGDHADQFRSFVRFAWGSGLRPGELFLLEWEPRTISHKGHTGPCSYIDLQNQSIHVNWRVFHSDVDLPKSNEVREVALLPPAAEALQGHPRRSNYVFVSKRGRRMAQSTLSNYWRLVLAKAGLEFDFYLATKHACVHHMWVELGVDKADIEKQMGWAHGGAEELLKVYGHRDIGFRERIQAKYRDNVVPLRKVKDAQ